MYIHIYANFKCTHYVGTTTIIFHIITIDCIYLSIKSNFKVFKLSTYLL